MATYEPSGKRWHIRRADGSLLANNQTGKTRYFTREDTAEWWARNITEQEQNPRSPSWRQVVNEARTKVFSQEQPS
jgi:hypothetical protein